MTTEVPPVPPLPSLPGQQVAPELRGPEELEPVLLSNEDGFLFGAGIMDLRPKYTDLSAPKEKTRLASQSFEEEVSEADSTGSEPESEPSQEDLEDLVPSLPEPPKLPESQRLTLNS